MVASTFQILKAQKTCESCDRNNQAIELSDGAIIESPDALSNLNFFLAAWGRSDLIKKTHFIPNPVTPEFVEGEVGIKENIVVSHGRWDDFRVKNTRLWQKLIVEFLKKRVDYRAVIFGSGIARVESIIVNASQDVKDRIEISGYIQHEKVRAY